MLFYSLCFGFFILRLRLIKVTSMLSDWVKISPSCTFLASFHQRLAYGMDGIWYSVPKKGNKNKKSVNSQHLFALDSKRLKSIHLFSELFVQFRIRGAAVSLSCHGTRGRVHPVQIASLLQDRLKPFTPNFTDHQTDCITITMLLAYLKVVEEVVLDMLKGAWVLEAHSASPSGHH